ncbi:cytochrome P450 [Rhizophagus irregularis]|uniref:Cytochrome P450 n=1 Tax=Rhizophagus irregularis TaxID=588596 RepID=A0A2I1FY76_9GLOM|nr:cytochrome P450 [Rhizophagus irregularis]
MDEVSTEFLAYIIGIIILIIFYIIKLPRIGANEPPLVPYTIPILGHTYNYFFNARNFFKKCKEQYGECFSIYVFGRVMTIVSRSSLNEVFINHKDFKLSLSEFLPFDMLFENISDFDKVTQLNAKLVKEITGKIDSYTSIMQKYLLEGIDKFIGDCKDPKEFLSIWELMNHIIALPMANIIVGEEVASHEDVNDTLEFYTSQPDFDYSNPKIFHYYIDVLFVLIFGSVGTTSEIITNGIFDLAGRPECLNELYEEAMIIDKECNGSITLPDVQKMKKLDSFVKEVLRHSDDTLKFLHKVTSESFTFSNGYTVPKGRRVNLYMDDVLKSKDAYGDDAEEFKPFRFVNANSSASKVDRNYAVFGGGKHACPGRFFAIHEIKLILHKLILKYNIKTKSGKIENKKYIGPISLPPKKALIFENRK